MAGAIIGGAGPWGGLFGVLAASETTLLSGIMASAKGGLMLLAGGFLIPFGIGIGIINYGESKLEAYYKKDMDNGLK